MPSTWAASAYLWFLSLTTGIALASSALGWHHFMQADSAHLCLLQRLRRRRLGQLRTKANISYQRHLSGRCELIMAALHYRSA